MTHTTAEAWTVEASELGRQAILDAEAQMRARRSPAELAREPLPEEQARLDELQASADVALGLVDAAKAAMAATLPPVVEGHARQIGSLLSHGPVETTGRYFAAKLQLQAAQEVEGLAVGRHTDYQMQVSAAGQARFVRMTEEGDNR